MSKLLATAAVIFTGIAIFLATRGQVFHRVNADGPTLRMLMAGRSGTTVVFEAGAGSSLETWTRIQPEVSKFAKTISYDRAGNGLSEKGAVPRDGRHIASELHAVLHNVGASPPYVLVGHSLGGPYIRIFAGMFPNEVAGLVLVDPTQEELIAWARAREPKPADEHQFRPYDEVDCAPLTFAQAREKPLPTDVPVILIAGMGPRFAPGFLTKELRAEVEKDQTVFYPAKLQFYRQWLANVPRGQLITTENSGHGIPYEEPELVIHAIRNLIENTNPLSRPGMASRDRPHLTQP